MHKVDELDGHSREFYERAKLKLTYSLFWSALGMMFLGFASRTGGLSRANAYLIDQDYLSDDQKDQYNDLIGGYGFACFAHLVGFILSITAAIYVSPYVSSPYERITIAQPQNFKFADSQSEEVNYGRRAPEYVTASAPIASPTKPKNEYLSNFATVNPGV